MLNKRYIMGSDSSHEFGEVMAAVIYIIIFALSVGIGIMSVRDTIEISGEYNVKQYVVLNSILSSLHELYYSNGHYYIPEKFIYHCGLTKSNFENCLHISLNKFNYYVRLYIGNSDTPILNIPGHGKVVYKIPVLVEYHKIKNFGWLEIGVNE